MQAAIERHHTHEAADDEERLLLADTARALADVQELLDRSRTRATRFAALQAQAASDQDRLIASQSRRIRSLESQLADLQSVGDRQRAALDEAMGLVAELESRMALLEQANTMLLQRRAAHAPPDRSRTAPDERTLSRELDAMRVFGSGDDLTRFRGFVDTAAPPPAWARRAPVSHASS